MSSCPRSKPYSRWETHRGSAAIDRELRRCYFYLLFFFFCFNAAFLQSLFLFVPHPCSLFLSLFSSSCIARLPPSLFLTLHCLFSDSKMWVSLYLDAPLLSPWFLSLYLTSFFFFFTLLKDRFAKALRDSSVLYSSCFLISLMSDNAASGYYIQMCFYKHSLYLYVNHCAAQLFYGRLWEC